MRTTLRCVGALATALLCVAVIAACSGDDSAQPLPAADDSGDDGGGDGSGGDDNGVGDNGGGDNGGGGATGIPGGGSGGGAPGAPMNIPAITNLAGDRPVDEVVEIIKSRIRTACGGDLCLVVEVDVQGDGEYCEYGSDPPTDTRVERGSTIVITATCDREGGGETGGEGETDTSSTTDTETDTGSTTDTETDAGSEVESEGTT